MLGRHGRTAAAYLEDRDAVAFTVSNDEIMVSSARAGIGPQDLAGVTFYAPIRTDAA